MIFNNPASGTSAGRGGGGHTSHIVKTLVSVELTTFHQHIYLHMAALCDITSTDLQHFGAILSSIPCHMTSKHDQSQGDIRWGGGHLERLHRVSQESTIFDIVSMVSRQDAHCL